MWTSRPTGRRRLMEQMLHLAKSLYIQHTAEMVLGLLACIFILMIINLIAVRRCRKQVRTLNEKTKDVMKLALRQSEAAGRRIRPGQTELQEDGTGRRRREGSKEDEEIFGSVIQEIFS